MVSGKKAAATVDLYEDFQCPHCLEFEQQVGAHAQADVKANKAQLRYHTMSFLDAYVQREPVLVAGGQRGAVRLGRHRRTSSSKYHDILFTAAVQPAEGTNGRGRTPN